MRDDRHNYIVDLSFQVALKIVDFTEQLRQFRKFEMASQLFKSGTSIGANIREAQNAESKTDFIHKFKVAAKEAEETEYWLSLCNASASYPSPSSDLLQKIKSTILVISKIIGTSKRNIYN